ncbi:MAG: hypothetical protein KAT85_00275 [candidate division Zixibacteria bacterium]|nr:hypothetical protein [candidate division Zixibacteria bacterium]
MSIKPDNAENPTGSRRQRRRLRGMFTGKTGKAIGFTSIAAPIIGYVVKDIRRPDSLIRSLIGNVARTLLGEKTQKTEAIDITDKVEVIEDRSEERQ